MKRRLLTLLYIAAALILAACDVHEFPGQSEHMPVALRLHFHYAMTEWNVSTYANGNLQPSVTRASGLTDGTMRYTVRLYPVEADNPDNEHTKPLCEFSFMRNVNDNYDTVLSLDVAPGTYAIKVWADFACEDKSFFYDISDFHAICLMGKHTGNTDLRDAFQGIDTLIVKGSYDVPVTQDETIDMHRPMAKFEFVSEDLQEFLNREARERQRKVQDLTTPLTPEKVGINLNDFRVVFQYEGYMPNTHNIFANRPIDAEKGITFDGRLSQLSDNEISLGFDYVFIPVAEGSVMVRAVLYNAQGAVVSLSDAVDVPLYRDVHTIVRGKFLTQRASGGMKIDPDFGDEYNIEIP